MPYQSQPLFEDAIRAGVLAALNEVVTLPLSNSSGAIVNISGTWVGTIVFEGTNDDFTTVQNAAVFTPPTGVITAGVTSNAYYRFVAVSGFTKIRARMSAYTSGTATVVISASIGAGLAPTVSINYDSMLGTSKLAGGTDGTKIGNVADALKVFNAADSSGSSGNPPTFSPKLRYRDMNASTGGVARGTSVTDASWVTLFSRSGSGILTGFTVNLVSANSSWQVRLLMDDNDLFGSSGLLTDDLTDSGKYNMSTTNSNNSTQGINVTANTSNFFYTSPAYYPIRYLNSISIQVKRLTGAVSKNFNAGLITLTEET